jgi:hypothetical protein
MAGQILKNTIKTLALIFFMSATLSCNSDNKGENKSSTNINSGNETIPDTVVRFLIASAANDFRNHQPPTPVDFRNVKIGYFKSTNNEKIFTLCGEFLSQENKEWIEFTTIKTSGYEQYIGKTQYCKDATMVLTDKNLSVELKNKFDN